MIITLKTQKLSVELFDIFKSKFFQMNVMLGTPHASGACTKHPTYPPVCFDFIFLDINFVNKPQVVGPIAFDSVDFQICMILYF